MNEPAAAPRMSLLQEVIARCSQLSIPAKAILELTYRCNLRCVHCYIDTPETDELTLVEWKGIIDQLKAAGTIYLLLTGGEALMRDDFLEIATYARRSGFIIDLMTNGTLLTHDLAQDIAGLKPGSITTSLYGVTQATHEAVTRVNGSYEKTIEGIRLLVKYGLHPLVQTVIMKSNVNELTQIEKLVQSLGALSIIDLGMAPSKTGADYPFQYEPSEEELVRCNWRPACRSGQEKEGQGLCKAGKALCSVAPGGDVFPCLMFPLKLGNLKLSSFERIWRIDPCAELRYLRAIKRTDLYACSQCHLAAYCQRCTGVAFMESGRPEGSGSSACRQAQTRWRLNHTKEVTNYA
jgi:radical SAM protein with 4Fe4S-binding SPASM domain